MNRSLEHSYSFIIDHTAPRLNRTSVAHSTKPNTMHTDWTIVFNTKIIVQVILKHLLLLLSDLPPIYNMVVRLNTNTDEVTVMYGRNHFTEFVKKQTVAFTMSMKTVCATTMSTLVAIMDRAYLKSYNCPDANRIIQQACHKLNIPPFICSELAEINSHWARTTVEVASYTHETGLAKLKIPKPDAESDDIKIFQQKLGVINFRSFPMCMSIFVTRDKYLEFWRGEESSMFTESESVGQYIVIYSGGCIMREGPGLRTPKVDLVGPGTIVTSISKGRLNGANRMLVTNDNVQGWITESRDLVRLTSSPTCWILQSGGFEDDVREHLDSLNPDQRFYTMEFESEFRRKWDRRWIVIQMRSNDGVILIESSTTSFIRDWIREALTLYKNSEKTLQQLVDELNQEASKRKRFDAQFTFTYKKDIYRTYILNIGRKTRLTFEDSNGDPLTFSPIEVCINSHSTFDLRAGTIVNY